MDTDAESEVSWFWLTRSGVWLLAEDTLLLTRPLVVIESYVSLLDWMLEDTIVAVQMSREAIGSQSVTYKSRKQRSRSRELGQGCGEDSSHWLAGSQTSKGAPCEQGKARSGAILDVTCDVAVCAMLRPCKALRKGRKP